MSCGLRHRGNKRVPHLVDRALGIAGTGDQSEAVGMSRSNSGANSASSRFRS